MNYNSYRSLLIASDTDRFDLPLDTVLFFESSWNVRLNRYVHARRPQIEERLRNYLDGCFPYHLLIVPAAGAGLSREMQERNRRFIALQRKLGRGEAYEVSFIARIAALPQQRPYGFYSIDVSLTHEDLIPEVLTDFLCRLTDYHSASLAGGVDYSHAAVQEHTVQRPPAKSLLQAVRHLLPVRNFVMPTFTGAHTATDAATDTARPVDPRLVKQLEAIRDQIEACRQSDRDNPFLNRQLQEFNRYLRSVVPHPQTVSPIVIATHRSRDRGTVTLTDYGRIVPMYPLYLLVYVLFLRHPEGLRLKDIPLHRAELCRWYPVLNRKSTRDTTIERLLDTSSNSLNETISRINRLFTDILPPDLARHYTINGRKGGVYSIDLPAGKVTYPEQLTKVF